MIETLLPNMPTTPTIPSSSDKFRLGSSLMKETGPIDEHLSGESEIMLSSSPNTSVSSYDEGIDKVSTSTKSSINDISCLFSQCTDKKDVSAGSSLLLDDFNESLSHSSLITMIPNHNINPTGDEEGDYLVIDLGGSTLRVAVISIDAPTIVSHDQGHRVHIIIEKKWEISNSFKVLNLNFFEWIGSKIYETLNEQSVIPVSNRTIINTGITWSFPLETTAHNNGKIKLVSKGYTISPEIHNHDLKQLLENTMKNQFDLEINIHVIVNDSLAVYAAGAFLDKHIKLAMVLGTGINMCCSLETTSFSSNKKIHGESASLFNCELSLFGKSFIDTVANKYDAQIDSRFGLKHGKLNFQPHISVDPISKTLFQPMELMTSGRYLSEIARLIIFELIESKEIFNNKLLDHSQLSQVYNGFNGELMCLISENDDMELIKKHIADEYTWDSSLITNDDIHNLKLLIKCIIKRASFIVSVAIISMIKLMYQHNQINIECNEQGQRLFKIGFVGSVLSYFISYRTLILKYINENEDIKSLNLLVQFKLIDHSSIIGASIGAAFYKNK